MFGILAVFRGDDVSGFRPQFVDCQDHFNVNVHDWGCIEEFLVGLLFSFLELFFARLSGLRRLFETKGGVEPSEGVEKGRLGD